MPKLKDLVILKWIDTALRERKDDCRVHWEFKAQQELARDTSLTTSAVNRALARAFIDEGTAPDIEIQKDDEYGGQERYRWPRLVVEGEKLYVKIDVQEFGRFGPRIDVVRCHKD